jgi:DNA-binding response OmpR family regulator
MGDSDNLPTNDVALFGPFRLFAPEKLLEKAGEPLQLGGRALDILITLFERAGQVVIRKELISRVWPDVIVEEANLRVHVAGLRKALGDGRARAEEVANVVPFLASDEASFMTGSEVVGRRGVHRRLARLRLPERHTGDG